MVQLAFKAVDRETAEEKDAGEKAAAEAMVEKKPNHIARRRAPIRRIMAKRIGLGKLKHPGRKKRPARHTHKAPGAFIVLGRFTRSIQSSEHPCQDHILKFVFQEHPCLNRNNVRVPRACGHQSIHARTIIPFVFQEHAVIIASMPKP